MLFLGSLFGLGFVIWASPFHREYRRRHQERTTALREFGVAEAHFLDAVLQSQEEVQTAIHQIRDLLDHCRLLPGQYQKEVANLSHHLEELARKAHLGNFFLTDATIPKIGDGEQTLASHNINTAADIDPAVLCQIKGFGRALIEYLMQWRAVPDRVHVRSHPEDSRGAPAGSSHRVRSKTTDPSR